MSRKPETFDIFDAPKLASVLSSDISDEGESISITSRDANRVDNSVTEKCINLRLDAATWLRDRLNEFIKSRNAGASKPKRKYKPRKALGSGVSGASTGSSSAKNEEK